MTAIEDYFNTLRQKSLFIICNDCSIMMNELSSHNFMYVTAFASMASPGNGFDEARFKQLIVNYGIRHFILVGHYDCKILKFLLTDQSENGDCLESKTLIQKLAIDSGYFESNTEHDQYQLFEQYMALQLQGVRNYIRTCHMECEYKIYISAIVIDEEHRKAKEMREMSLLLINESLN